jgi:Glucodextranase, domain B/PASTA domain
MRALPLLAAACVATALVVVGCGGEDEPRAARAQPPVRLAVNAPADLATVREGRVAVQGTVSPARAAVQVLGRAADVTGGSFSATVPVEEGANVIDVIATAAGRAPAMTAIRVTREVRVEVPDLGGMQVEDAQEKLDEIGLTLEADEEGGGLLDELLPGEPTVCVQQPEPGAEVRRGSTVHVVVSETC